MPLLLLLLVGHHQVGQLCSRLEALQLEVRHLQQHASMLAEERERLEAANATRGAAQSAQQQTELHTWLQELQVRCPCVCVECGAQQRWAPCRWVGRKDLPAASSCLQVPWHVRCAMRQWPAAYLPARTGSGGRGALLLLHRRKTAGLGASARTVQAAAL
jgi:hypothetical protein